MAESRSKWTSDKATGTLTNWIRTLAMNAKLPWTVLLCLLTVAPLSQSLRGATYYVATNGNNGSSGSASDPWVTPGFASRQLKPGDTLIIRSGRYRLSVFDEDIIVPGSGRSNAWITIRGEVGQRPVLAGRDNLFAAVILSRVNYLRIENLEITHDAEAVGVARNFRDGINITGQPCSHLVLRDLYVHHLDEFGVDMQDVEDLQLINSRIEYCGIGAVGGPRGTQGGLRDIRIQGCSLSYSGHYYQGTNLCPCDRPDGFGILEVPFGNRVNIKEDARFPECPIPEPVSVHKPSDKCRMHLFEECNFVAQVRF